MCRWLAGDAVFPESLLFSFDKETKVQTLVGSLQAFGTAPDSPATWALPPRSLPRGCRCPWDTGRGAAVRGSVSGRCCGSPCPGRTQGTTAGQHFLPGHHLLCVPRGRVHPGKEPLPRSLRPHATLWGLAQVLCSLAAHLRLGSIVAHGPMSRSFLCLFSLPKIFVQQQSCILNLCLFQLFVPSWS